MSQRGVVLVVEDDDELRGLYRDVLMMEGFDVHPCADGLTALRFLEHTKPVLIVLDLGLPDISGVDIYAELRAHADTHDIPVVICTGLDSAPEFPDAKLLRKPCGPDQLLEVVRELLRDGDPASQRETL